jgi:hypothetical protein
MANKLVDLCLDVTTAGVSITIEGNGGISNPADPPYEIQVFHSMNDLGVPFSGKTHVLDTVGPARLIVWDATPPAHTKQTFEKPTEVSERVKVTISGGAWTLSSASGEDPWPTG